MAISHLENGSSVNSDNFDATDLRFCKLKPTCKTQFKFSFSFLCFSFFIFPDDISIFFFVCYLLREKIVQHRVIIPQGLNRVSSAQQKLDTSAGTGKLCILGHLGLVFIWSCFVSCLLFLLFYVSLRNLCSGTCRKIPKVKPCFLDGLPNTNTLCCNNSLFFLFSFCFLQGVISDC